MHRFLRWIERDLVCSAPFVQLGLTLLGFSQDGDDAGIVCELFEPIQIVRLDNFLKTGLVDGTPCVFVEQVPERRAKHGALEDHVLEDHLIGELALNHHMCRALL